MALKPRQKIILAILIASLVGVILYPRLRANKDFVSENLREPASSSKNGQSPGEQDTAQVLAQATPQPETPPARDDKREQALARLQRDSRAPWQTVLDPENGRLRTLEMGRLEVPAGQGPADLVRVAQVFLAENSADLFGVTADNLRFDKIVDAGRSKLIFEQYIDGRRVLGGTLALIYENDALVRIQNDLVPETVARPQVSPVSVDEMLAWIEKHATAKFVSGVDPANQTVKPIAGIKPELVYLPSAHELVLAYAVYVDRYNEQSARIDRARILVDAQSPRVIKSDRMIFN